MSVQVKICGITNVEDALAAVAAGADALGFMFYEPSPRKVSIEAAGNIICELPPLVAKVGVFVNAAEETVRRVAGECGRGGREDGTGRNRLTFPSITS